jgi:hypothetical protein
MNVAVRGTATTKAKLSPLSRVTGCPARIRSLIVAMTSR